MALTAQEEFARLKKCINVAHYIGPRSTKVIEDALGRTKSPEIVVTAHKKVVLPSIKPTKPAKKAVT